MIVKRKKSIALNKKIMKKLSILSALVAISFYGFAQNVPSPEFKNKVMFVETNNTLSDLDKTDMTTTLKTSMTGHSEVNIVANGKSSAQKHMGAPTENFIVKIEPGIDPENVVELFQFNNSKKDRKILVAEMSMGKDNTVELKKSKLSYKKISDGVYEVSCKEQLEGGEYCFLVNRPNITVMGAANSQALVGYCFSVEGK